MKDITSKQLFCAYIDRIRQEGRMGSLTENDVRNVASLIISEINESMESPFISCGVNAFEIDKQIGDRLVCLKISCNEAFDVENALKIEDLCRWLDLINEYYMSNGKFTGNPYVRFVNSGREQHRMKRLPGQKECQELILKLDKLISRIFSIKTNKNETSEEPKAQGLENDTISAEQKIECDTSAKEVKAEEISAEVQAEKEIEKEIEKEAENTEIDVIESQDTEENSELEIVVEEDENGSINVTFMESSEEAELEENEIEKAELEEAEETEVEITEAEIEEEKDDAKKSLMKHRLRLKV